MADSLPTVCYSEFSEQQKQGGGTRGEEAERERGKRKKEVWSQVIIELMLTLNIKFEIFFLGVVAAPLNSALRRQR